MAKIEFKKSKRQKTKLRIALVGPAGSGKTLGALYLGAGIAGGYENVCVIDTENGRSLLYSNRSDLGTGEFYQADLEAPYTVEKYIEYLESAAELVGEEGVVIVDSLSPAWSGTGGVLQYKETIESRSGKNSFSAWNEAGKVQNRLIDTIMHLDCHVVVTMRAKTSYVQEQDMETGKTRVRKLGLAADQRDSVDYEFGLVFNIQRDGNVAEISKDTTFLQAEGWYGRLDEKLGKRLRDWVDEAAEPVIYTCEHCGKKIKSYVFEDGSVMSPQDIVAKSKESYNATLCIDCCIELSQQEEQEEENVEQEEE